MQAPRHVLSAGDRSRSAASGTAGSKRPAGDARRRSATFFRGRLPHPSAPSGRSADRSREPHDRRRARAASAGVPSDSRPGTTASSWVSAPHAGTGSRFPRGATTTEGEGTLPAAEAASAVDLPAPAPARGVGAGGAPPGGATVRARIDGAVLPGTTTRSLRIDLGGGETERAAGPKTPAEGTGVFSPGPGAGRFIAARSRKTDARSPPRPEVDSVRLRGAPGRADRPSLAPLSGRTRRVAPSRGRPARSGCRGCSDWARRSR